MNDMNYTSNVIVRIDRKQLINQLRALSDNYIKLHLNTKDLTWLAVADSKNYNRMATKN